jgi:hypothetical protein
VKKHKKPQAFYGSEKPKTPRGLMTGDTPAEKAALPKKLAAPKAPKVGTRVRKSKHSTSMTANIPRHAEGYNSPTDPIVLKRGKKLEPMEDTELQSIVAGVYGDAATFTDVELSPQRAEATEYYLGQPFGNEDEGRSQVVLPEVRAIVLGILPGMLRMFFQPDRVVEFIPENKATVEAAEQATQAVNSLFMEECEGFKQTFSVMKDGLIRRMGVYKWWWDDTSTTENFRVQHLTDEEVAALQTDPEVGITRIMAEESDAGAEESDYESPTDADEGMVPQAPPGDPNQPAPAAPRLSTVEFTIEHPGGRVRLAALPPEEFIFARETRGMGEETYETLFAGHRRELKTGQLLSLGVSQELIDQYGGSDNGQIIQVERRARDVVQNFNGTRDIQAGEANENHLYVEGFIHVDYDGDGYAELRRVCTLGPTFHVVSNLPARERPFAIFCPDPEPHELLGLSVWDKTEMQQRVKSSIFRSVLDSLSQAVTPRLGYVEGEVSPGDIMNTAVSAPLRMKSPNAIQVITTPFVGEAALPVMGFLDDHTERQTGQNKGVTQLDADALQSSTPGAVRAAVDASKAQQEMVCRIFAEYTLKRVMRGMYGLIKEHQPKAWMVKMRGQWTEVDPRNWPATLGMRVNVGIGQTSVDQKIAIFKELYASQLQIVQVYGPDNPMYPVQKISRTAEKILQLNGIEDVDTYMTVLPPDFKLPPQPPPPPSPEQISSGTMKEMEKAKTLRELTIKSDELKLSEKKSDQQYDLELRKMAMEFTLKRYQIDAQFKANYTEQQAELDARAAESFLRMRSESADTAHSQMMDTAGHALDVQDQMHSHAMDLKDQDQEDAADAADAAEPAEGE